MKAAKDVDTYIKSWPSGTQKLLTQMRSTIRATAPSAVEGISYQMPAYKYEGKPLIYFAAAKEHVGLYGPAVVEFEEDLQGYSTSKGTLRFPLDKPVPAPLVKKLVKARMAAIDAKGAGKKNGARKATPAKKPAKVRSAR
jgi:uncharacterized protein YdhG (YjbR/CyaY superfamily)